MADAVDRTQPQAHDFPVDVTRLRTAEAVEWPPRMELPMPAESLMDRLARIEAKVDALSQALLEMGQAMIARGSL